MRFKRTTRLLKIGAALTVADYLELLPGQTSANLQAVGKGFTNAAVSIPTLASCAYDYSTSLKGLEYPSDKYTSRREECHQRSSKKVLKLAQHCGGIYLKAG